MDGFALSDYALLKQTFELQQVGQFVFEYAACGHACPVGDNVGNHGFIDAGKNQRFACDDGIQLLLFLGQAFLCGFPLFGSQFCIFGGFH